METTDAVQSLAALAQDTRLQVFRLLVQAGPEGLTPSAIGARLGLAPATLSFHLNTLKQAGLIEATRHGRSLNYAARFDHMNDLLGYLTENCCGGEFCDDHCAPAAGGTAPQPTHTIGNGTGPRS